MGGLKKYINWRGLDILGGRGGSNLLHTMIFRSIITYSKRNEEEQHIIKHPIQTFNTPKHSHKKQKSHFENLTGNLFK